MIYIKQGSIEASPEQVRGVFIQSISSNNQLEVKTPTKRPLVPEANENPGPSRPQKEARSEPGTSAAADEQQLVPAIFKKFIAQPTKDSSVQTEQPCLCYQPLYGGGFTPLSQVRSLPVDRFIGEN